MAQAVQEAATASQVRTPKQDPPYISWEEFLETCDEHAEWVDGRIIYLHREIDPETGEETVSVSTRHNLMTVFFITLLAMHVEIRRLGRVLHDPVKMKVGPDLPGREPDVAFVSTANLSRIRPNQIEGPADLVIEIVSGESVRRDRGDKFREYEQGGVREYWVIDPDRRLADFYVLGEDGYYDELGLDAEGRYHSAVVPGVWVEVDWLWQEELPEVYEVLKMWGAL